MNGTFAGIDYDTRFVHVVLVAEDEDLRYSAYKLEGADAFDRARHVRDVLPEREWWVDVGVVACAIEEQRSYNPKTRDTTMKLKMIQGAILSCLPTDLLVEPIDAQRWKSELDMKGNAKKEDVEFWCRFSSPHAGRFSGQSFPQDFFDAYCLAVAASRLTQAAEATA